MNSVYNKEEFYRAHLARDSRFDGQFFVAVKTTMIYCRPICSARKAQLKNLEFFTHAAQAEEAGFRPSCLRCRPETAPGSTAWMGTSAIIQQAIRLMDCFATEEFSVSELAAKLGVGERWLRELFQQHVGVSPSAILMSKKLDIAKNLLDQSTLPITEIAFSSGFQSIRRFNDAFKTRFQKSPRAFRKAPLRIMLPFLVIGFDVSFATPAMTFAAIHSVTSKYSGIAAAILNTVSQVGSLIGVAVFGTIVGMSKNFILAMHTTLFLAGRRI